MADGTGSLQESFQWKVGVLVSKECNLSCTINTSVWFCIYFELFFCVTFKYQTKRAFVNVKQGTYYRLLQ